MQILRGHSRALLMNKKCAQRQFFFPQCQFSSNIHAKVAIKFTSDKRDLQSNLDRRAFFYDRRSPCLLNPFENLVPLSIPDIENFKWWFLGIGGKSTSVQIIAINKDISNHCVIPFGFRKVKTENFSYQF